MRVQSFWLPKSGLSSDDYEDAFQCDEVRCRCAIADGATESSFAGRWARLLVEDFVNRTVNRPVQRWPARLPALRQKWWTEVNGRAMSWYAEEKLAEGASATFLGLVFRDLPVLGWKRWQALAVGDSCLFQVRRGRLITAFPVTAATDFGSTPALVNSSSESAVVRRYLSGSWRGGDWFWLMTDALAQWFLRQHEDGRHPEADVQALLDSDPIRSHEAFLNWIARRREEQQMRNDDVTLVAIKM